jgi:hypothetical protein
LTISPNSNDDEAGGQRAEEEPLLAPMPPTAANVAPNSSAGMADTGSAPTAATGAPMLMLLFSLGAVLVVLVGFAVLSKRRAP